MPASTNSLLKIPPADERSDRHIRQDGRGQPEGGGAYRQDRPKEGGASFEARHGTGAEKVRWAWLSEGGGAYSQDRPKEGGASFETGDGTGATKVNKEGRATVNLQLSV